MRSRDKARAPKCSASETTPCIHLYALVLHLSSCPGCMPRSGQPLIHESCNKLSLFFEFSSTAPALTGQGAVEPQSKKPHLGPGFYPALDAASL